MSDSSTSRPGGPPTSEPESAERPAGVDAAIDAAERASATREAVRQLVEDAAEGSEQPGPESFVPSLADEATGVVAAEPGRAADPASLSPGDDASATADPLAAAPVAAAAADPEADPGSDLDLNFDLNLDLDSDSDADADGDGAGMDPALLASLAETFAEELRDMLLAVPDLLKKLVDPAEQLEACLELGRLFHTIKGSAAVVGREDLREPALALQVFFERVEDEPEALPLTEEGLRDIVSPIGTIFLAAGLEPPAEELELAVSTAGSATSDPDDEDGGRAAAAGGGPEQRREFETGDGLVELAQEDPDRFAGEEADGGAAEPAAEPEIMEAFAIDAKEALDASETALLQLERDPRDLEQLRALFRHFHTLKGAAAAVGRKRIAHQLHVGESLLESVIERRLDAHPEAVVEVLLELVDSIAGLIAEARGSRHDHRILVDLEARIARVLASGTPLPPSGGQAPGTGTGAVHEATGDARQVLPTTVAAGTSGAEAPGTERPGTTPSQAEAGGGIVRVPASRLDLLMNRVSELVVSRTRINDTIGGILELKDKLNFSKLRLHELIEGFRGGFEFGDGVGGARLTIDGGVSGAERNLSDFSDLEFEKYDDFNVLARTAVELSADAGEIVEQLSGLIDTLGDETRQFSKVTSSLQRTITRMRLVSVDTLFKRLQRPARDAARQLGKQVEVVPVGGEVQLDRGLIESLYGPLLHLVRNSVSHGIESTAVRRERGKPESGRIELRAEQRHGSVSITVRDDGNGLDFDAIRRKAGELGLVPPGTEPTRDRLSMLIFQPGFSTHGKVDDLSGRGVGMDVVAREVDGLRGSVSVESVDGQGASFRISVPITAVIDQVLLVRSGTMVFALSQAPIETVVNIEADQMEEVDGRRQLLFGDARVPVLPLAALLDARPTPAPPGGTAVLLRSDDRRIALLVDRIEAQREAVIRPLGRLFASHPFLASATFGGDGQVIFVLDASRMHALLAENPGIAAVPPPPIGPDGTPIAPDSVEAPRQEATVLWVDDSISVRTLAQHFLQAEEISVATAVDGLDALDKLRHGSFRVLITDLEMPRLHGYELIQQVRSNPALAGLPVVVCSSRSSEKHRRRAREAGADGYLTKPFTQEAVGALVRELVSSREAATAPLPAGTANEAATPAAGPSALTPPDTEPEAEAD